MSDTRHGKGLVFASSFLALVLGCASEEETRPAPQPRPAYELSGTSPVGVTTFVVTDEARGRTLRVEAWYPAEAGARDAADAGADLLDFATPGAERDALRTLLATAPDPGTNRRSHAARDAKPADTTPMPVVVLSHCYDCTRFSTFTVAERLASHGIAVVAPDHTGGTLFDKLAGTDAPLDTSFLAVRRDDLRLVLDRVLDASATEVPPSLRGRFDATRVGAMGHSFGAVTAGLLLMDDPRPRAGLALAAPMENPLLPGVRVAEIEVPLFYWLALEDNSITELGNGLIRSNYTASGGSATKVEVADAGHWSVSDICGIVPDFDAGCTDADARQTNGEAFRYHDIDEVRAIAASYATAFFLATLTGDAEAAKYVATPHPDDLVSVASRP